MTRSAALVAAHLGTLAGSVGAIARAPGPTDRQRYLRASAELIGREVVKLDGAVVSGDGEVLA